jgi:hypothetical protein
MAVIKKSSFQFEIVLARGNWLAPHNNREAIRKEEKRGQSRRVLSTGNG